MGGRRRMGRWLVVAAGALVLTACKDNGLRDRNLPLEEAEHRAFRYAAYESVADNAPVAVAGQHWLGSTATMRITPSLLVPVGDASGRTLYALKAERAPYDRLFASAGGNQYHPFLRIE